MSSDHYGELCHYKNKLDEAQQDIRYWKRLCEDQQRVIEILMTHGRKRDPEIEHILERLFPPAE